MPDFEKNYYEAQVFWGNGMLEDADNLKRFEFTMSLIPPEVQSIADVGCGNGVFVNTLQIKKNHIEIVGIDRSLKALEYVQTKKVQGNIIKLPFDNNRFDCVTCLEVLEHLSIEDYEKALDELTRVAGKYVIISVPFNEKLEEAHTQCPACKSIFNYEMHLRNFNETAFVHLLDDYGFENRTFTKLNKTSKFIGHFRYRKLFYPEQLLKWRSPVCPLCGFKQKPTEVTSPLKLILKKRKMISYISSFPKMFWPKEYSYYWIIGLFEKVNP